MNIVKKTTMTKKVISPRKQLNVVLERLDEIRERRAELYEEYQSLKSEKKRAKFREVVRPLDLLLESFFYQAHKAYKKFQDELEEIDVYEGFDKKMRIVYCDGSIHLVTSKKGRHLYGYFCNCEE